MYSIEPKPDGTFAVLSLQPRQIGLFYDKADAALFVDAKLNISKSDNTRVATTPLPQSGMEAPTPIAPKVIYEPLTPKDQRPTPKQATTLAPSNADNLPSVKTFTDAERDAFLKAIIAGEKAADVALRMGKNPDGARGYLSGKSTRDRRQQLTIEAEAAQQALRTEADKSTDDPEMLTGSKVAFPTTRNDPLEARRPLGPLIRDRGNADLLGRPPRRVAFAPSQAVEAECGGCGKTFMAADRLVDPRCAKCRS